MNRLAERALKLAPPGALHKKASISIAVENLGRSIDLPMQSMRTA